MDEVFPARADTHCGRRQVHQGALDWPQQAGELPRDTNRDNRREFLFQLHEGILLRAGEADSASQSVDLFSGQMSQQVKRKTQG